MLKEVNEQAPEHISERYQNNINTILTHNLRGSELNLFIRSQNSEALKKTFR